MKADIIRLRTKSTPNKALKAVLAVVNKEKKAPQPAICSKPNTERLLDVPKRGGHQKRSPKTNADIFLLST
jgi:hypothetical protein